MLSPAALARIDKALARYPADQKQSAVMAALTIAQDEQGYLSTETWTSLPSTSAWRRSRCTRWRASTPCTTSSRWGKHKLCICTNLPCALSGANDAARRLKQKLGVDWGETTPDGRFTLQEGECFGACGDAPVILHNNKKLLIGMTPEKIDRLIAELSK